MMRVWRPWLLGLFVGCGWVLVRKTECRQFVQLSLWSDEA